MAEEIVYDNISGGIVLNENPHALQKNESPNMINVSLSRRGIFAVDGYEFLHEFPDFFEIVATFDIETNEGYRILAVTYPNIYIINPRNWSAKKIYGKWYSTGFPRGAQGDQAFMLVDGANKPLYINTALQVTEVPWPQQLVNDNNAAGAGGGAYGNIRNNPYNKSSNQRPDNAQPPYDVLYVHNRFGFVVRNYPKRVWWSRVFDQTDFRTNTPADWDIAFWVDLPTPYSITGWEVLNNDIVIIYLTDGYIVQTGFEPPGEGYTVSPMRWVVRDTINGLQKANLVVMNGDGDHFYITKSRLFSLRSSDNFNQARTKGLSDKIFPLFKSVTPEMWQQAVMINNIVAGELRIFLPYDEYDGYCERCFIYKYTGSTPGWTIESYWGEDFRFTNAHLDKETSEVYVFNKGNRVLLADSGTSFDGEPIRMVLDIRPEDFGKKAHFKNVKGVAISVSGETDAEMLYRFRWEDESKEGIEQLTAAAKITEDQLLDYTNYEYNIQSDIAAKHDLFFIPFKGVSDGVILNQRIETLSEQNLVINFIALVYEVNGVIPPTVKPNQVTQ